MRHRSGAMKKEKREAVIAIRQPAEKQKKLFRKIEIAFNDCLPYKNFPALMASEKTPVNYFFLAGAFAFVVSGAILLVVSIILLALARESAVFWAAVRLSAVCVESAILFASSSEAELLHATKPKLATAKRTKSFFILRFFEFL